MFTKLDKTAALPRRADATLRAPARQRLPDSSGRTRPIPDNAVFAPAGPTTAERTAAATATATSTGNACESIRPFYWEIGDATGALASGSVTSTTYPWIDSGKTIHGVLARSEGAGSGLDSVDCGRLVRRAWVTAVAR